jgi:putative lipoprotein
MATRVRGLAALAAAVLLLAACAPPSEPTPAPAPEPDPQRIAFTCADGYGFEAWFEPDRVRVQFEGDSFTLPQVESGSGTRYRGEVASQGGTVLLHTKGRRGYMQVPGLRMEGCEGTPVADAWQSARVRGVELRALGQEPGWWLELDRGRRTLLVTDYGREVVSFPAPAARVDAVLSELDGEATVHLARGGRDLLLTVSDRTCRDIMSGFRHPLAVRLRLDGTRYDGCGRRL